MSNTTRRLSLVMATVFTAFTMMSAAVPALGVAKKKVTKKVTKKVVHKVTKKVTVKKVTVNPDVANYNKALAAVKVAEGAFKYDMTNPDNIAYVKVKADLAQTAIENIIDSAKQAYLGTRLSVVENKIATVEDNYAKAQASKPSNPAEVQPVASATALNNTTVVVKFSAPQTIASAADFTFDNGLTVTQAVVKQDDVYSIVLTTSSQDSTKTYKLSYKGTDTGLTVTGMAVATTPSAITMTTSNTMGTLGVNNTVTATVTPASAGVPVTFNVICDDSSKATINTAIVKEVMTDAKGVATLTYTRYYGAQDDLSVYPTGSPAIRATGNVYWGSASRLTCVVTSSSATASNSGTVIYKITYLDSTGSALSGKKLNVMFKEDINASGSTATALPLSQGNGLSNGNLYQRDQIDNANALELVTDSNGVATFQVTGSNTTATPIIYTDETGTNNNYTGTTGGTYTDGNFDQYTKLKSSFLQITAPVATFNGGTYTITADQVTGTTVTGTTGTDAGDDYGTTYAITVKKSDGTADNSGTVSVGLQELMNGSGTTQRIAGVSNNSALSVWNAPTWATGSNSVAYITLNSNGQASFNVTGTVANQLATPVIWVDANNNNQVDNGESQYVAGTSLFVAPAANGVTIHGYDDVARDNKITTQLFNAPLYLSAYVSDQSGNAFPMPTTEVVTYTIQNTGSHPATIMPYGSVTDNIASWTVNGQATNTTYTIPVNTTSTVVVTSTNGASRTYLTLESADATTLNVGATVQDVFDAKYYSTSNYALTFVNPDNIPQAGAFTFTGTVSSFTTGQGSLVKGSDGVTNPTTNYADTIILKLDGSGDYISLPYFGSYDNYAVGSDFTNQSYVPCSTFTQDLSVGDRIQVTGTTATSNIGGTNYTAVQSFGTAAGQFSTWKLINVDGSSDSSIAAPGSVVAATGGATASTSVAYIPMGSGSAATYTSSVIPAAYGTMTFDVTTDGTTTAAITLSGNQTAAQVATVINTTTAGITLTATSNSFGQVILTASSVGSGHSIAVTNSTNTSLFSDVTATGTNAVGTATAAQYYVTINTAYSTGDKITINGHTLTCGTSDTASTFTQTGNVITDAQHIMAAYRLADTTGTYTLSNPSNGVIDFTQATAGTGAIPTVSTSH